CSQFRYIFPYTTLFRSKLVTEEMVKEMKPGSVIVDIAIDQGGIFETSDRITTHDDPIYVKHDVVHYAVANMPGAVPQTSTVALTDRKSTRLNSSHVNNL